jgi:hypothetical protein
VTGRVDEVDAELAPVGAGDAERGDRGADGDAAGPFERERVGHGVAVIDAADRLDGAGGVEQPLGQAGLTGVDMGENSQIEHAHQASCPSHRWWSSSE